MNSIIYIFFEKFIIFFILIHLIDIKGYFKCFIFKIISEKQVQIIPLYVIL